MCGMPAPLLLADLVATSAAVAATPARTAKRDLIAGLLRRTPADEVGIVAAYLSGTLPQGRIGLGWRSLPRVAPSAQADLGVAEVDATFSRLAATSGPGSAARRTALATALYGQATADEQGYLGALLTGNLRQGSLEGPLLAAMAVAYDVPEPVLRRGLMYAGRPGPLAEAAATGGAAAVTALRLEVGRAVRPMLAGSAKSVAAAYAVAAGGPDASLADRFVQAKLDGVRIQVHVRPDDVRVFTRSLDDITDRLPETVALARSLPVATAVFDGEVIALDAAGRPHPFQVTGARTASTLPAAGSAVSARAARSGASARSAPSGVSELPDAPVHSADASPVASLPETTPLTAYLFDVLHLDGRDLVDEPLAVRDALLREVVPAAALVAQVRAGDAAVAEAFLGDVLAAGHEGVVIKDAAAPYAAGRRGSGWVKVKPVRTLDLVVLAVEQGSGRRQGWLSNIHLGARDPATGDFVMVGKTFKGMTDAMLRWQTERFRELAVDPDDTDGYVVRVRPEQVVEIALDGVQTSRRYPGGVALRFARVVRYRDDKTPEEVDSIHTVQALA